MKNGFVLALVALLWGCSFDASHLESRYCGSGDLCPAGTVCCRGYCVIPKICVDAGPDLGIDALQPDINLLEDRDGDGVQNGQDNCPDHHNPLQLDHDNDGRGDGCDCAPTNPKFAETAEEILVFSDPLPFAPVEQAGDWALVGGVYRQGNKDGIRRAAHETITGNAGYVATARFRLFEPGDDGLTTPDKNISMAGVVVRTASLGDASGTGYYCGVDLVGNRLLIGKTVGADLAQGRMSLYPSPTDPFASPGTLIKKGVAPNTPYQVTLTVQDNSIACRLLLPDLSVLEIVEQDPDLSSGGVALFTLGIVAQFEAVKICAY